MEFVFINVEKGGLYNTYMPAYIHITFSRIVILTHRKQHTRKINIRQHVAITFQYSNASLIINICLFVQYIYIF